MAFEFFFNCVTVQPKNSPFQCWKIVKCKIFALDQSVLSTLHRSGEGQNTYKMKFVTLVTKVVALGSTFLTTSFQILAKSLITI